LPDRRDSGRGVAATARAFAIVALGVVVLWILYQAREVLLIIYISVLLAIGFGPFVHAIETQTVLPVGTKRLPRWFAILVIYLMIVGALIGVGLLVIPPLLVQAGELWRAAPQLFDRAQNFLIARGVLDHRITLEEVFSRSPASPGDAVGTVAIAATRVVSGLFEFVTVLVLTFYLLIESDSLFRGFTRLFAREDRPEVQRAATQISLKVSAWLHGQLILAGTIGVSAAVGLFVLGVPYFYVLALVAAVGEMIPMVGPILSAIPIAIVGFTVSTETGVLVLVFLFAQQQFENHLLVPKVMERQVGVSPVTVIVALLIGGSLLGIIGALLAVPTAAILQVIVQVLLDERDRLDERSTRHLAS
jgi:predicted PurR-regulated permease PerM